MREEMEDRQVETVADYLRGKSVTLCVSGGIAAIEMPKVARMLRRYGAEVRAVMSESAQRFITPLTMEWATGCEVVTGLTGKAQHIDLEDAVLVAPATLNTMSPPSTVSRPRIICGPKVSQGGAPVP